MLGEGNQAIDARAECGQVDERGCGGTRERVREPATIEVEEAGYVISPG